MPYPYTLRARVVKLRRELELLARQALATSVGSPDRAALDEKF